MNTRLRWALSLVVLILVAGVINHSAYTEPARKAASGNVCNFQASFMTWDLPPPTKKDPRPNARHNIPRGNRARIQLEAITDGEASTER